MRREGLSIRPFFFEDETMRRRRLSLSASNTHFGRIQLTTGGGGILYPSCPVVYDVRVDYACSRFLAVIMRLGVTCRRLATPCHSVQIAYLCRCMSISSPLVCEFPSALGS